MNNNIILLIYLRAGKAVNGPPLGTTLGNYGVQTAKFIKDFNAFTQELPDYFLLSVKIEIAENKSYTFSVSMPSIGFILSLLKKQHVFKNLNGLTTSYFYINLSQFLLLCKLKLSDKPLNKAAKMLKGSLLSSNIKLVEYDIL